MATQYASKLPMSPEKNHRGNKNYGDTNENETQQSKICITK